MYRINLNRQFLQLGLSCCLVLSACEFSSLMLTTPKTQTAMNPTQEQPSDLQTNVENQKQSEAQPETQINQGKEMTKSLAIETQNIEEGITHPPLGLAHPPESMTNPSSKSVTNPPRSVTNPPRSVTNPPRAFTAVQGRATIPANYAGQMASTGFSLKHLIVAPAWAGNLTPNIFEKLTMMTDGKALTEGTGFADARLETDGSVSAQYFIEQLPFQPQFGVALGSADGTEVLLLGLVEGKAGEVVTKDLSSKSTAIALIKNASPDLSLASIENSSLLPELVQAIDTYLATAPHPNVKKDLGLLKLVQKITTTLTEMLKDIPVVPQVLEQAAPILEQVAPLVNTPLPVPSVPVVTPLLQTVTQLIPLPLPLLSVPNPTASPTPASVIPNLTLPFP